MRILLAVALFATAYAGHGHVDCPPLVAPESEPRHGCSWRPVLDAHGLRPCPLAYNVTCRPETQIRCDGRAAPAVPTGLNCTLYTLLDTDNCLVGFDCLILNSTSTDDHSNDTAAVKLAEADPDAREKESLTLRIKPWREAYPTLGSKTDFRLADLLEEAGDLATFPPESDETEEVLVRFSSELQKTRRTWTTPRPESDDADEVLVRFSSELQKTRQTWTTPLRPRPSQPPEPPVQEPADHFTVGRPLHREFPQLAGFSSDRETKLVHLEPDFSLPEISQRWNSPIVRPEKASQPLPKLETPLIFEAALPAKRLLPPQLPIPELNAPPVHSMSPHSLLKPKPAFRSAPVFAGQKSRGRIVELPTPLQIDNHVALKQKACPIVTWPVQAAPGGCRWNPVHVDGCVRGFRSHCQAAAPSIRRDTVAFPPAPPPAVLARLHRELLNLHDGRESGSMEKAAQTLPAPAIFAPRAPVNSLPLAPFQAAPPPVPACPPEPPQPKGQRCRPVYNPLGCIVAFSCLPRRKKEPVQCPSAPEKPDARAAKNCNWIAILDKDNCIIEYECEPKAPIQCESPPLAPDDNDRCKWVPMRNASGCVTHYECTPPGPELPRWLAPSFPLPRRGCSGLGCRLAARPAPIAAAAPVAFNWNAAPTGFNPVQYCGYWAGIGECGRNPNWMLTNCQLQCTGGCGNGC